MESFAIVSKITLLSVWFAFAAEFSSDSAVRAFSTSFLAVPFISMANVSLAFSFLLLISYYEKIELFTKLVQKLLKFDLFEDL